MTISAHALNDVVRSMNFWTGETHVEKLSGGITNVNFKVTDETGSYVVRLGNDILVHQVMRFNELAASKAAEAAGISPTVVHHEPGILVLKFIPSRTLEPGDIATDKYLPRIVELIHACHHRVPEHFRGPGLIFWVFHILRDYAHTLRDGNSEYCKLLPDLLQKNTVLEEASGPHEMVFGHNDLLAANFLDDGARMWLIDWDYAGFNNPLFDLGGLASNNEFSEEQEIVLLEHYYKKPPSEVLWRQYQAMKCASLLRETMWSMVSQIHSQIEFDYQAYSQENLSRFNQAYGEFSNS